MIFSFKLTLVDDLLLSLQQLFLKKVTSWEVTWETGYGTIHEKREEVSVKVNLLVATCTSVAEEGQLVIQSFNSSM